MGDPKTTFWQEISNGVGKALIWLMYITMGVVAKLAFDSRSQRLTSRQIVIKTLLSIFAGVMAAIICENMNYKDWGKVIVPVSTLVGEGIVVYVMTHWRRIAMNWLPTWAQKVFKK